MRYATFPRREKIASGISGRIKAQPAASTQLSPGTARGGQPSSGQVSSVGKALEPETQRYFESRFCHDFGKVRVHADSAAASSTRSAAAHAHTVGHKITFGAGMFSPKSPVGKRLLAHELTHVVQQENPSRGGAHENQHESEAAHAGEQASQGDRASVGRAAPVSMQRQGLPGAVPHTDLTESAAPLMAAAIGLETLDGFATGKSDVSAANQAKLGTTAETILKLLKNYPASKIRVIGYTDAVGQEKDNQALGLARADSVQAALVALGIPEIAIKTESRGASDLVIKTDKAEPRNRRVRVAFEPSTLLRGAMSQGLTVSPGLEQPAQTFGTGQGAGPGAGNICFKNPTLCGQGGSTPGGKPGVPPSVFKPIPDNTPYHLMDRLGINEPYTSHGRSPNEAGGLSQAWAQAYWKYKNLGLSESLAAKAANSEISSTAGKAQSRDNPNAADRLDSQMKQAYPNATTLGPGSVTLFKF
jgi:outer membrane protein OmpA-like peptidoglycan-associated protein